VPNENRIAFFCESKNEVDRIAAILAKNGAVDVDGPPGYDENYYAIFFDDPDGNKLEVCFLTG
jgi:predicted lactoylglutathione lyase